MIRQTAVGVRNESPALEQDDLRIFIKPAKSCRASRAGSDAADYKCFAHFFPFCMNNMCGIDYYKYT